MVSDACGTGRGRESRTRPRWASGCLSMDGAASTNGGRMTNPALTGCRMPDGTVCAHPAPFGWSDASGELHIEWCPVCGAIRAQEAIDIPVDVWVCPSVAPWEPLP